MKLIKKKISLWKVASVLLIFSITIYTFSCQKMTTVELDNQVSEELIAADNEIFQVVDTSPDFNGGITEFYTYVRSSLNYTDKALKAKVSGKVFVEFVVNTDGSISHVKILRGIGHGLDEEAKRVVANSPTWIPGSHKDNKVNVRMVLPITFRHPDYPENDEQIARNDFEKVKDPPSYPGGITEFFKYVQENLAYPQDAKEAGIEGKVFIEFTVDTDGSISKVKVKRGIGSGCDEEAKRIIENSPNWIPMKVEGKEQSMTMVLPITFKLE